MNLRIIGISGTNGSGKDTVGNILADDFGYLFLSMTEPLRREARKRHQAVDRSVLHTISSEWRHQWGLSVLVDKAFQQFEDQKKSYSGLAMASLRHPAEASRVHELGGIVIWLDAEPSIRYNRIIKNADQRDRSAEDNKSFEEFLAEEREEMYGTGDKTTLDMSAVKAVADILMINEFLNVHDLEVALSARLGLTLLK